MIEENEKNVKNNAKAVEKIPVRISIAGREYRFKIYPKDEENIRNAAKQIKEKVIYFQKKYPNRDDQDTLSMATLQLVLKLIDVENNKDLEPIQNEINDLNARLESYLDFQNGK